MGDIHLRKLQDLKTYLEEQKRKNQKNSPNQKIEIAPGANHSEGTKSIHVFKGHSRRVTSLMPIKEKGTYFVSASLDGKVRIWCIEKMIELYCFDISIDSPVTNSAIDSTIQNVILINDSIYAMIFHQNIEIGLISHLASSYFISKQNICSLVKCYQSSFCRRINKPKILSVQFSDNSLVLLDPSNQKVFSTIYPPPTQAEISKVFWCSSIQRMFLLLKSGSLCIYQTQKETGILEKLQESTAFKDYESKPLA
jgi:WD40 repeat protein